MASNHEKQSGIALLSVYGVEDDQEVEENEDNAAAADHHKQKKFQLLTLEENTSTSTTIGASDLIIEEEELHELSSAALPSLPSELRPRKARLTIVDCENDEVVMSPEAEVFMNT